MSLLSASVKWDKPNTTRITMTPEHSDLYKVFGAEVVIKEWQIYRSRRIGAVSYLFTSVSLSGAQQTV